MSQTQIFSDSQLRPRAHVTVQQSTEKDGNDSKKAPLTDSVHSRFGSSVGGYDIQAELGRGGMGIVFRAFDPDLKRSIALKILSAGASASEDELIRFRGEAELVAKLQHPNIVQIFEIGQHDNMPFLALEYIDGGTLAKLINGQPQAPRKAAEWVETLARAVHVAHVEGVIHRDLKPANVLMTKAGLLKVTDFGLAKNLQSSVGLSHDGQLMGTPSYMAPEQAFGKIDEITARTDVYALGAILYELLTGRPPFRGATMLDTLEQVRQVEATSPSRLVPKLPRELCTITLKCLEKAPERRYATAEEFADDLRRWVDGERIKAKPVPLWKKTVRVVRRRPYLAAQLVMAALAIALVVLWVGLERERNHRDEILKQRKATEDRDAIIAQQRAELFSNAGDALDGILKKLTEDEKISKMTGLDPLHEELFSFYEKLLKNPLSQGGIDAEQLARLANVYRKLGELTSRSGKKELAMQAFDRSLDFFSKLTSEERENGKSSEWKRDRAAVLIERGRIGVSDLHDYEGARKDLLAARSLLEATSGGDPTTTNSLAETYHLMGEVFNAETEYDKAIDSYQTAIRLRDPLRPLHEKNPRFKRDLARDYGYLGDVQLQVNKRSEADASYWASHELRNGKLRAEQRAKLKPEEKFQLARSWHNLADFQLRQRFFDTAIDFEEKCLSLREELVAADKANTELSNDLAQSQQWAAELYLQKAILAGADASQRQRALKDGLVYLNQAHDRYKALYDFDAKRVGARRGRADVLLLLARWKLLDKADAAEARRTAVEAGEDFQFLAQIDTKDGTIDYSLACVEAIKAETGGRLTPTSRSTVLELLKKAQEHSLQKHPQTIREDRALEMMKDDSDYKKWIDAYSERYFDGLEEKASTKK